jgi:hypothetical protein
VIVASRSVSKMHETIATFITVLETHGVIESSPTRNSSLPSGGA